MVTKVSVVMTSKYVNENVGQAIDCITQMINNWSSSIDKLVDESEFKDDVHDKECSHEEGDESTKSQWLLHWDEILKSSQEEVVIEEAGEDSKPEVQK